VEANPAHIGQTIVHHARLEPFGKDFVWRVDVEGKTILPNGEPKPCKLILMKNVENIIKGISCLI